MSCRDSNSRQCLPKLFRFQTANESWADLKWRIQRGLDPVPISDPPKTVVLLG